MTLAPDNSHIQGCNALLGKLSVLETHLYGLVESHSLEEAKEVFQRIFREAQELAKTFKNLGEESVARVLEEIASFTSLRIDQNYPRDVTLERFSLMFISALHSVCTHDLTKLSDLYLRQFRELRDNFSHRDSHKGSLASLFLNKVAALAERRKDTSLRSGKTRILIVEDDLVSRKVLTSLLSQRGEVQIAIDGNEAIDVFLQGWVEGRPFDLICLDLALPKLNGRDVLRYIRGEEALLGLQGLDGTKVVITTVNEDPKEVIGSFKDGCEGYLCKPIHKAELDELLAKLFIP